MGTGGHYTTESLEMQRILHTKFGRSDRTLPDGRHKRAECHNCCSPFKPLTKCSLRTRQAERRLSFDVTSSK